MSTNDRLIELFHQAKGIPAGEERDAFMTEACQGDVELRDKVRALLQADETADDFLSAGIPVSSELEAELLRLKPEVAGDRIGPYKLREQIGEGGFGVVWVAEQEVPMRRTVALKIIKLGMDTREVVARFEQERQALALMDHPNIAKVFDAGATEYGRPYFVMELVRGTKITDYCDQANLPTEERLALFIQVCQAVQHAHQKGIIHRDLKPSNILVALNDGVAVPKVIDFGVAKATQGRISERTVYTQFQQMIGTPLYMSPEQAEMSGLDIDTRTDIYALGVLLYELLTGRPPFDADAFMKASYDEMRRVIREEEPQKPSTALQSMAQENLTTTAHHRGSEPPRLIHAICGDLDWIVMKCLEKDRTRRYETASGLGRDIERHLENKPVSASPPSAAYRFGKFARRHKAGLRVAVAILLLLLVAIIGSSWLAIDATQAKKLANKRLEEVSAERDAKEVARQEAEAISKFMGEVFQSPDPARDGRTITVVETLDRAAQKLETDLADQPARRARLQAILGKTYNALGLPSQGIPLLEQAMKYHRAVSGPEHPATLETVLSLAHPYGVADYWDEGRRLLEKLLPLRLKELGPEHDETLRLMSWLAASCVATGRWDEALKMREEMLAIKSKVFGPEHHKTIGAMWELADSYAFAKRYDEALKLSEETLRLTRKFGRPESPFTLSAIHALSLAYGNVGRRNEQLKLLEEVLTLRSKVYGQENAHTLVAMTELANCYRANGDLAKAETLERAKAKAFWGDRAEDSRVTRLYATGLKENDIQIQAEGTWSVKLTDIKDFTDLTIFQGTRVSRLTLKGTAVADLSPLRGLALKQLNLEGTKVTDLTPLQGMPIEDLALNLLPISDLTVLRGMPIQKLELNVTAVADLEPLRGMALKHLAIHRTKVTDLSPLKGMPLEYLNLRGTAVKDISVVRGMPLTNLRMFGCKQLNDLSPIADSRELTLLTLPPTAKDIEFLRTFPKLERLSFSEATPKTWLPAQTAAEFWEEYTRRNAAPEKPANASLPSR